MFFTSYTPSVYLQFGCDPGLLTVEATTSCGQATASKTLYQGCGGGYYILFPNPTDGAINIGKNDSTLNNETLILLQENDIKSATFDESIEVEVYNFNGTLIKKDGYRQSTAAPEINLSQFKSGIYFIRIKGSKADEIHEVVLDK